MSLTVMTVGTFDNFHEGHRALLNWCRALAGADGQLIVGVNQDSFVPQYKNRVPVQDCNTRARAIGEKFPRVNVIMMNPQQAPGDSMMPLLEEFFPDLLVVGDDWMGPHYLRQIGVSMDELWDLGTVLAFKPRGPKPIHSSQNRTDS